MYTPEPLSADEAVQIIVMAFRLAWQAKDAVDEKTIPDAPETLRVAEGPMAEGIDFV
ncbi:hypothetical protein [Streptomyces hydrogenans]